MTHSPLSLRPCELKYSFPGIRESCRDSVLEFQRAQKMHPESCVTFPYSRVLESALDYRGKEEDCFHRFLDVHLVELRLLRSEQGFSYQLRTLPVLEVSSCHWTGKFLCQGLCR